MFILPHIFQTEQDNLILGLFAAKKFNWDLLIGHLDFDFFLNEGQLDHTAWTRYLYLSCHKVQ